MKRLSQSRGLLKQAQKLSKVVQDAILFVQSIGEKHLWVDSLCIAQDDVANKHD